jgi:hypothetical protein
MKMASPAGSNEYTAQNLVPEKQTLTIGGADENSAETNNRKPGPLRLKEDSDIHSSDVGVRCDW